METVRDRFRTYSTETVEKHLKSDIDYKLLVETASDLVFITDPNGFFTFTNPKTEEKLGLEKDELIGRHLLDFIREDYQKSVFDFYRNQYKTKIAKTSFTFPIVVPENEFWLDLNVKSIVKEGEITGFMAVAWDVSEKIKTTNTLRAINQLAKDLLGKEELSDIAWHIAKTTLIQFGFVDCVIYLKDETGKKLRQIAAYGKKNPKEREILVPITLRVGEGIVGGVAKSGKPEMINDTIDDFRYILDDDFRLSELAVPIIHNDEVIGVIDSEHPEKDFFTNDHLDSLTTVANLVAAQLKGVLDKKAKLKVENDFKQSEEHLRSVVNSSMDAIITICLGGKITEWNPQATVMFGYTKEEAIGKDFLSLVIANEQRETLRKGLSRYIEKGEKMIFDKRLEMKGLNNKSVEFDLEISMIPTNDNNMQFFSAFLRDISEQTKSKLEMENALAKEKELNDLKTRFITLASHEFRTPLTTIQSSVDLLNLKLADLSNPQKNDCEKNLNRIEGEVDRLNNTMNDILMMGQVESGKIPLHLQQVDLIDFCIKLIENHFNSHRKDGRYVEFKVTGIANKVSIDPNLFTHVLINLLSNSFKFSANTGNPTLEVIFIRNKVRIVVSDKGIGIPKEDLQHLFGSFYRANNAIDIQGTGLGLSLVKEFVDMHKGIIKVNSVLNEGTQFSIELTNKIL